MEVPKEDAFSRPKLRFFNRQSFCRRTLDFHISYDLKRSEALQIDHRIPSGAVTDYNTKRLHTNSDLFVNMRALSQATYLYCLHKLRYRVVQI